MSKKRYKAHGDKREGSGFAPLPHVVLRSSEFAALSPFAVKAFMDLLGQYRGDNNGDLCAAWTIMAARGWRSRDSLAKGIKELRESQFIVVTRQGGRHRATLYGFTFYEIDWCAGKLDISAPTRRFMGSWHKASMTSLTPLTALKPSTRTTAVRSMTGTSAASPAPSPLSVMAALTAGALTAGSPAATVIPLTRTTCQSANECPASSVNSDAAA